MQVSISKILNHHEEKYQNTIFYNFLETPLGEMLACEFEGKICLLEFLDTKGFEKELTAVSKTFKANFKQEETVVFKQLKIQLAEYFTGNRKEFSVPLLTVGTDFQKNVWEILQKIPYGETKTYEEQTKIFGNPKAIRAVASANGRNKIAIIIPCHRVIGKNGTLTGYAGGLWRKQKLLELEKSVLF